MPDPTAAATPTNASASGAATASSTSDTGSAAASSAPSGQGAGGEPAAPSSTPSSSDASASPFDFDTLFSASDPDAVSAPEATPATPATPVQPVAGAEPAQPTAPTAAPPTPAQPPVSEPPAAQPAAQAPPLDFSEPAAIAQRILSDRANVEAHVAKQLFTLSQEEIESLETDVVGTIPKLLAKAYVASQTAMLQQLQQVVPLMAQKLTQQTKRYEDNSAKFFKKWPQIDQQKHGDLVYRYGVVYRQMNPQASLDQMISDLGPLVMQAAGIAAQPTAPRTPTAFTPAPNGGAVGLPTAVQPNAFAFMQETGED